MRDLRAEMPQVDSTLERQDRHFAAKGVPLAAFGVALASLGLILQAARTHAEIASWIGMFWRAFSDRRHEILGSVEATEGARLLLNDPIDINNPFNNLYTMSK